MLGTPLPEEDAEADAFLTRKQREEKYKNKFVPVWQQEVLLLSLAPCPVRRRGQRASSCFEIIELCVW